MKNRENPYLLANQRNQSTNSEKIRKEQKSTQYANSAIDICEKLQILDQFVVAEKPAANRVNPLLGQQIQIINNTADCQLWMPILKS